MSLISRIILISFVLFGCSKQSEDSDENHMQSLLPIKSSEYAGSQQCITCHQAQYASWQDSHHDLAMQDVNEKTVLGDFSNTKFDYYGAVTSFFKKDDKFIVNTDGPDGKLTDYPIAYAFGVYPLQQYLIKFPKGGYQVLSIAWDSRSKLEGGQRWFHLYPDEHITHNDELHWTGINQNWNFMCADCHSTNLDKNYDVDNKEYSTTWSEIDVACEACHGPASRHIDWSSEESKGESSKIKNKGFLVEYNERKNINWNIDAKTGNASRSKLKQTNTEIEACSQCHSRRLTIKAGARPEHKLLDNFQVSLLTEPLYHADGQINGEVYVYGSFVQSKMFHAGVTCSDCHEPHSLVLRAQGNDLCSQCHLSSKYNSGDHHLHKQNSAGSQCVSCHMPSKIYMGVDSRRDHSFRIPRPDLSVKLGTPDACNQCHKDKTSKWSEEVLKQKYGAQDKKHYAEVLHAGRTGSTSAPQLLAELITDDTQPAIARATAVTLLPAYLSRETAPLLQLAANDEQALVGLGAAISLESVPEQRRLPFAYPLLYDPSRSTRVLAGRSLMGGASGNLPQQAIEKLKQATDEYESTFLFNADRPESLVSLAGYYLQQGDLIKAEKFYKDAISLAPYFTPAYINLADLYRGQSKDASGETVLRNALLWVRDKTPIQHAIGLYFVRQKKLSEAMEYLQKAAESITTTPRYVYVYAIALHSSGKSLLAIEILEQAHSKYPNDIEIIQALISINREIGNSQKAQYYEDKFYH